MSGVFEATVEATEEAIYNSLFQATTVSGSGHTAEAIPLDKVRQILAKYHVALVGQSRFLDDLPLVGDAESGLQSLIDRGI